VGGWVGGVVGGWGGGAVGGWGSGAVGGERMCLRTVPAACLGHKTACLGHENTNATPKNILRNPTFLIIQRRGKTIVLKNIKIPYSG
jgi:hypothetical protein